MPRKSSVSCHFGCPKDGGPLHSFPKSEYPHTERFNKWKSVLDSKTQERGDKYICNSKKLCNRHFEDCFKLPSRLLTYNAIPTLNLGESSMEKEQLDIVPMQQSSSSSSPINYIAMETDQFDFEPLQQPSIDPLGSVEMPKIKIEPSNKIETFEKSEKEERLYKMRQKCILQKNQIKIARKIPRNNAFKQTMAKRPTSQIIKLLNPLVVKPGVNSELLNILKKIVTKMPEEKRLVNLLFDEIPLSPALIHNEAKNEVIGFEDNGTRKTKNIADHALVFMIKSIKSKMNQPIAFTFCKGTTGREELKALLYTIITDLQNIGLQVISTICDQCPTNVAVIKSLVKETNIKYTEEGMQPSTCFIVNNNKIFPLFDTPHLLKGVRNILLTKNAKYYQNGKEATAKWEHLQKLLDIDDGYDETRLVNKLTANHVMIEKLNKTNVKLAAQVFSQRVSSALRFLSKHNILPAECEDTADFLYIFDKLFDSFNGHTYKDSSNIYRSCIKKGSPHFRLWDDLLPIVESIKFESVDKNSLIKYESIPSIEMWIQNIETFREMFDYLTTNYDITYLIARNFNQDPLQSFFSTIRSNGNPNCKQFIRAFKSFIVNIYNSHHSANANCEDLS